MEANKELTAKHKIFCNEYLRNGFNATQAAIKAGYSENTARQTGYDILTYPYIRDYIDKRVDFMLADKQELTKQWIDECKRYAFMSADVMEIEQVRASDKKGFMDLLGKYLTLFTEKKDIKHTTLDANGNEIGMNININFTGE